MTEVDPVSGAKMMGRRHHNTKGLRQVKVGKTRRWVRQLAKRLGIPYGKRGEVDEQET